MKSMKKLRLELDQLRVDTFSTTAAATDSAGTVRGHDRPSYDEPCEPIPPDYTDNCPPYTSVTCGVSCNGTCYGSCYGSCANTCYSCRQQTCPGASCYPCYPVEPIE
jgi:modification target Cys-rich repeat protein